MTIIVIFSTAVVERCATASFRYRAVMSTRLARCSCGQLSVKCEGDPLLVSLCHCLECQLRTGGPFGIAAFFDRNHIVATGDATTYVRPADSGFEVAFHFCPRCGSTVWWQPSRLPDRVAVAIGAFADPAFPAPNKSVYGQHRHPWVTDPTAPTEDRDTG